MILIDANVLIYAYHPRSPHHDRCRLWLEAALGGDQPVAICWIVLLAFLRISTNARAFELPLTMAQAIDIVAQWLARPSVVVLEPGPRHWEVLQGLIKDAQITSPLVTDAAIAALAFEHGAALCTTDRDFKRFDGLRLIDPLAS